VDTIEVSSRLASISKMMMAFGGCMYNLLFAFSKARRANLLCMGVGEIITLGKGKE
jgi:hypothetical protein